MRVRMQSEPVDRFLASLQAIRQDLDRLPDATVQVVLGELERLRVQTAALLVAADPASFDAYRQRELVRRLEDLSARFVERYGQALALPQSLTYEAGQRLAAEPLVDAGVAYAVPQASRRQLEVARAFQASLISHATAETIGAISIELRLGLLRGDSVFETAGRIAGSLESPGPFGSLATRAEAITRTELGRIQAIATQAGLEESQRFVPDLQKQWMHSGNMSRWRRLGHVDADGQIRDVTDAFRIRSGPGQPYEELQYPRDPSGSPGNTIFCFLPGTLVRGRFVGALKAGYAGPAREIKTARGHRLRVTPNHPVLTSDGWLPAGMVQKGQYLLGYLPDVWPPGNIDAEDRPATAEQVFEALAAQGVLLSPRGRFDLHGDVIAVEGNVQVAGTYRELLLDGEPHTAQLRGEFSFMSKDPPLAGIHRSGSTAFLSRGVPSPSCRSMRGLDLPDDRGGVLLEASPGDDAGLSRATEHDSGTREVSGQCAARYAGSPGDREQRLTTMIGTDQGRHVRNPHALGFSDAAEVDALLAEVGRQRTVGNAGGFLQIHEAFPSFIAADQVTEILDFEHRGHVYDLQSVAGVLVANALIVSNCGCLSIPYRAAWADALKEAA